MPCFAAAMFSKVKLLGRKSSRKAAKTQAKRCYSDFDINYHHRSTGSFKKNGRPRSEEVSPHQYGSSLTDKELLDVPAATSRNARTAPSTPDVEAKPFPRHAESTSHLEMASSKKTKSPDVPTSGHKSPQKEVSPKMNKSRNEKFHKIFRNIPDNEVVLNAYSCAYFGDILLQGYLYISPNWFCFYSKILGHEKHIEIPVSRVKRITKEKTAFIIPNAIGITTDSDRFVFGSFMSRDNTISLMFGVWKRFQAESVGTRVDDSDGENPITVSAIEHGSGDSGNDNNNTLLKPDFDNMTTGESSEQDSHHNLCTECGEIDQEEVHEHLVSTRSPSSMSSQSKQEDTGSRQPEPPGGRRVQQGSYRAYIPYVFTCFDYHKTYKALCQLVVKIQSMPRTNLLLAVCTVLVLFLLFSAVVMTYKIILLQAQLDSGLNLGDSDNKYHNNMRGGFLGDMYYLNYQFHTATVERLHAVLRANIQLLGQVHDSLQTLQHSPLMHKACEAPAT